MTIAQYGCGKDNGRMRVCRKHARYFDARDALSISRKYQRNRRLAAANECDCCGRAFGNRDFVFDGLP